MGLHLAGWHGDLVSGHNLRHNNFKNIYSGYRQCVLGLGQARQVLLLFTTGYDPRHIFLRLPELDELKILQTQLNNMAYSSR